MADNIINFPGTTVSDIPADQILDCAKEHQFDTLFVIGWTEKGDFYFAGTTSDLGMMSIMHRRMGAAIDEFLKEVIL